MNLSFYVESSSLTMLSKYLYDRIAIFYSISSISMCSITPYALYNSIAIYVCMCTVGLFDEKFYANTLLFLYPCVDY